MNQAEWTENPNLCILQVFTKDTDFFFLLRLITDIQGSSLEQDAEDRLANWNVFWKPVCASLLHFYQHHHPSFKRTAGRILSLEKDRLSDRVVSVQ